MLKSHLGPFKNICDGLKYKFKPKSLDFNGECKLRIFPKLIGLKFQKFVNEFTPINYKSFTDLITEKEKWANNGSDLDQTVRISVFYFKKF